MSTDDTLQIWTEVAWFKYISSVDCGYMNMSCYFLTFTTNANVTITGKSDIIYIYNYKSYLNRRRPLIYPCNDEPTV